MWEQDPGQDTPFIPLEHRHPLLFTICVAMAGAVFALDAALPLGFAGGIPYVAVLLLASRIADARSVFVAAAGCTTLVMTNG